MNQDKTQKFSSNMQYPASYLGAFEHFSALSYINL